MRKLAIFSAAFALAAAVYVYELAGSWVLWLAAGSLVLSVFGRLYGLCRVSIFCIGITAALFWCSGYEQMFLKNAFLCNETEQTVRIEISQAPYLTARGASAYGRLGRYEVILYGDETLLSANAGDAVTCRAFLKVEKDNLQRRSDGVILRVYGKTAMQIEPGVPSVPQRLRMWMQEKIDTLYSGQTAGLVKALLTGDRFDLSYETKNALSVAGLSHAVAVSGMHVSILITMVAMLCGYQPRLMAIFGIPVTVLFALMTGASPSVCRAAVMQIMLLLAPLVRRERDSATTLGAAALVLLVQNPWCIASISFQLSFAAVAGLMLFSSPMHKRILSLKEKPGKILSVIASGVSATLSAALPTLPLTIYYFGLVSIVAPLTNLLVLWAVTGVFTLGMSSCFLGEMVSWAAALLSRYILAAADIVAALPFSAAYPYNAPLVVWSVVFYFFLAAVLLFRRFPVRWGACLLTAGFLACTLVPYVRFVSRNWGLHVLDVGQGQCLVLQIGDYTALIDCGGSSPDAAGENAARFLGSVGVSHVDALILTHYDLDHAGGAAQFLARVAVDTVYLPSVGADCEIAEKIEGAAKKVEYISSLTEILLPNGYITLLPPVSTENSNNAGVCVLARAEEYDILITGDIDQNAEWLLLSRWELPDVDLLIAGHHGAKTSTSEALLQQVRPEIVAISVDGENSYGHPHDETLQRLENFGAAVYRTDLAGDLYFHP